MDYKEKYLKYKKKYLMLKNQLGGVLCKNNTSKQTCTDKKCTWIPPKGTALAKCQQKPCSSLTKQQCTSEGTGCKWISEMPGSDAHCNKKN